MEIHKHADKRGERGANGNWPLTHVEIVGDVPAQHSFRDNLVTEALDEGWMRFEGKPMSYTVQPDPLGAETRFLGEQTVTLPGDRLVMSVHHRGRDTEIVWKITRGPTPRGFRVPDKDEPSGFSATHSYEVTRQGAKK